MLSSTLLFLSAPDITVILIVALVLFGGKKLPELARGLGQGIREFKDATDGVKNDINNQANKEAEKPVAPVPPPVTNTTPTSDLPAYTPVNEVHTTPPNTQP